MAAGVGDFPVHRQLRPRLDPFGSDIGVDQPASAHKSTSRAPPGERSISRSEPRSGEAAKNSARVPLRPVLRAHSSIATTTTAGRPFLVISCGPSLSARSMTSLSRALACATDQAAFSDMLASPVSDYRGFEAQRLT